MVVETRRYAMQVLVRDPPEADGMYDEWCIVASVERERDEDLPALFQRSWSFSS
jgi:hypothetical protein